MKYFHGILFLLIFILPIEAKNIKLKKIVVFLYDAGETFGLLPVYEKMKNEVDISLIPLTPWTLKILKQRNIPYTKSPPSFLCSHIKSRYNKGDISFWTTLLEKKSPDIVLTGMVSRIQMQLAMFCRRKKIKTIGFYDAFDPPRSYSVVWGFMNKLDIILVPTREVAKHIRLHHKKIIIAGQPSVESWIGISKTCNIQMLRKRLYIPQKNKVILFAGQYGKGYEKIFRAFLEKSEFSKNVSLLISPHPKTKGLVERKIVKSLHRKVLFTPACISTAQAVTIADVVVTWTSTVGVQAAFTNKTVIYFGLKMNGYNNRLIKNKIAFYATPQTMQILLKRYLFQNQSQNSTQKRLLQAGYILGAAEKIRKILLQKNLEQMYYKE